MQSRMTVRLQGGAVFCSRQGETTQGFATRITVHRIVATELPARCATDCGTQSLHDTAKALVAVTFREADAKSKLMGMDIGHVAFSRPSIGGELHIVVRLPEGTTVSIPIASCSPEQVEQEAAALAILAYELAVAIGPNGVTQRLTTVVPDDTTYLQKSVRFKERES